MLLSAISYHSVFCLDTRAFVGFCDVKVRVSLDLDQLSIQCTLCTAALMPHVKQTSAYCESMSQLRLSWWPSEAACRIHPIHRQLRALLPYIQLRVDGHFQAGLGLVARAPVAEDRTESRNTSSSPKPTLKAPVFRAIHSRVSCRFLEYIPFLHQSPS